jgi:hypothetical protein
VIRIEPGLRSEVLAVTLGRRDRMDRILSCSSERSAIDLFPQPQARLPSGGLWSWEYSSGMKLKTSVTLSEDILKTLKRASRKGESRSETIERLLRESLAGRARRLADQRDLEIINRHADRLNAEAEDVLEYQTDL